MERKILLDANLLIAVFDEDGDTTIEKREQAKKLLEDLLSDKEVSFAITPLIRYEVLRGAKWEETSRYQKLLRTLNRFMEFEINREIAELASDIYRMDKHQADEKGEVRNLEKRKFDAFHYATAKCLQIEVKSHDKDFSKLDKLYEELKPQGLAQANK